MKISIVYVSQTGNTEAVAESIQDGILAKMPFCQVKLMDIRENETDTDFIAQSDAVIFGSPVYFTSMSWELKKWFDQSFRINLSDKLGAAFVTAQFPTGGTDTAIMEMIRHMLVKGMLVFSGSGREAKQNFQIGAVGIASNLDETCKIFEAFGASIARKVMDISGAKL